MRFFGFQLHSCSRNLYGTIACVLTPLVVLKSESWLERQWKHLYQQLKLRWFSMAWLRMRNWYIIVVWHPRSSQSWLRIIHRLPLKFCWNLWVVHRLDSILQPWWTWRWVCTPWRSWIDWQHVLIFHLNLFVCISRIAFPPAKTSRINTCKTAWFGWCVFFYNHWSATRSSMCMSYSLKCRHSALSLAVYVRQRACFGYLKLWNSRENDDVFPDISRHIQSVLVSGVTELDCLFGGL